MSSRWQAHKMGLINFWYYDEQEFPFVKGRILLRGSNGSGKSVTMQSVVPLLLDGDLSPERLDPFGSRDRKMVNYLLEDDDPREERTGYLYLEFKRTSSCTRRWGKKSPFPGKNWKTASERADRYFLGRLIIWPM